MVFARDNTLLTLWSRIVRRLKYRFRLKEFQIGKVFSLVVV